MAEGTGGPPAAVQLKDRSASADRTPDSLPSAILPIGLHIDLHREPDSAKIFQTSLRILVCVLVCTEPRAWCVSATQTKSPNKGSAEHRCGG
jgi:hypothetical protein